MQSVPRRPCATQLVATPQLAKRAFIRRETIRRVGSVGQALVTRNFGDSLSPTASLPLDCLRSRIPGVLPGNTHPREKSNSNLDTLPFLFQKWDGMIPVRIGVVEVENRCEREIPLFGSSPSDCCSGACLPIAVDSPSPQVFDQRKQNGYRAA